ncbi:OmpA family protein [uncultured Pseudomonas sp.]|uniref:OmpA family protein n=1 Tax=uncultured Pseudomonas sp. TaxID=114707 RepID=UPI0025ED0C62|nr:OmpA family protein [uncultured Pseudomonas sp.]
MKLIKSTTLILCLGVSACSSFQGQDAQSSAAAKPGDAQAATAASGGHWWWPFGAADKPAEPAKPVAKAAEAKPEPKAVAKAPAAKPEPAAASGEKASHWWWPFGGEDAKPVAKAEELKPVPVKVSKAWLDEHEQKLRVAVAGSNVKVERRDDALVLVTPVDGSFNPDRAEMLLPVMLGPLSRSAKSVSVDEDSAVIVLGFSDSTGAAALNDKISLQRAQAVAAIFRLSGYSGNRLIVRGLAAAHPRADNATAAGRAANRRVEVLIQPRATVLASLQSLASR